MSSSLPQCALQWRLLCRLCVCVCVCVCVWGGGNQPVRDDDDDACDATASSSSSSSSSGADRIRAEAAAAPPPPPITTSSSSSSAATKGAQCCSKLVSPLLSSPLLPGLRCSGSAAGCAACRPCSRCFSPDSQRLPRISLTTNWATSITAKSNASSPSKTKAPLK